MKTCDCKGTAHEIGCYLHPSHGTMWPVPTNDAVQCTLHDEYVMAALTGLTQKLSPSDWGVSESSAVALRGLVATARAIADEAMRQREPAP